MNEHAGVTLFWEKQVVKLRFTIEGIWRAVFRRTRWQSLGESNPSSQIENLVS